MFKIEGADPIKGFNVGAKVLHARRLGLARHAGRAGEHFYGTTTDMEEWERSGGVGEVREAYRGREPRVYVKPPSGRPRAFHPFELTVVED